MPPDNLLVRLAVLSGAEQKHVPAGAGMAAILHWEPLLPPGYRVGDEGLFAGGRLVLRAGGRALAELVIGYRGIDDILLQPDLPNAPGVALPGGDYLCSGVAAAPGRSAGIARVAGIIEVHRPFRCEGNLNSHGLPLFHPVRETTSVTVGILTIICEGCKGWVDNSASERGDEHAFIEVCPRAKRLFTHPGSVSTRLLTCTSNARRAPKVSVATFSHQLIVV